MCHIPPTRRLFLLLVFVSCLAGSASFAAADQNIPLLPNETWWGGRSVDGPLMPYDSTTRLTRNLYADTGGNQAQPLLVSSQGRFIWSEQPFKFEFRDGVLLLTETHGEIRMTQAGSDLRSAFAAAARKFFPADGHLPAERLFSRPQFNSWIELMYDQNQRDILRYAHQIHDNGYPAGVLMIDDNWQEDYGQWEFSARKFPDPKAMMQELRGLGFEVMLWVCPFISPDSENFRLLEKKGWLLMEPTSPPAEPRAAMVRWWNGVSGCLDLTHPEARSWFKEQLDRLGRDYRVAGFKFDAGDPEFYAGGAVTHAPSLPNDQTTAYAQFGLNYPFNEYRAAWKAAGRPLAQRLRDKTHTWEDLGTLIPGILAQGLMGYAFTCPDLIGGGEYLSFIDGAAIDQELVVRSAQVHALMPMMQFSAAPWRVLTPAQNAICRRMAELHTSQADLILDLARHTARTGEPIIRPLCWQWPEAGYEHIHDEFMLGDDILVAPVVTKGAVSRRVTFPPGNWRGDDGSITTGPSTREIAVPIERLPWFRRENRQP